MEKGMTVLLYLKPVTRGFVNQFVKVLVPYTVLFKSTLVIYHNGDLIPPFKLPQRVVVYFLHMPEAVTTEIFLHEFEKLNLLGKKCIFILFGLTGAIEALVSGNDSPVLSMLVKSGELPPVYISLFVRFTVEHIGVNATDGKSVFIDPAPAIFQKPAGSGFVVLCPQGITGNIENTILIAKFGCRSRFESGRIQCFYCGYVTIEQEYVAVERPGTAFCA